MMLRKITNHVVSKKKVWNVGEYTYIMSCVCLFCIDDHVYSVRQRLSKNLNF